MNDRPRLLLPAIRGHIGDWVYYVSVLELRDVADRVGFASDMRQSKDLADVIQRAMTKNAQWIATYLRRQPQRFMNGLVIAVDGGEPRFHELVVRQTLETTPETLPDTIEMNMGVMELRGDERLMAVDGQHRVRGVQLALQEGATVGTEQVTAIFIRHDEDQRGIQRTRRLFTTLNRYAKPVSVRDKIAQDEDDVIAIVVRDLIDGDRLLRSRVSQAPGTSLPRTDRRNVTTLPALYAAADTLLRDRPNRQWNEYKRFRPVEAEIRKRSETLRSYWRALTASVPALDALRRDEDATIPADLRGPTGGHLLLRPVGLMVVAAAARALTDDRLPLRTAVSRLSDQPFDLAAAPWPMLLWNPGLGRMVTDKENQKLAAEWLALASGGRETGRRAVDAVSLALTALDPESGGRSSDLLRARRHAAANVNATEP